VEGERGAERCSLEPPSFVKSAPSSPCSGRRVTLSYSSLESREQRMRLRNTPLAINNLTSISYTFLARHKYYPCFSNLKNNLFQLERQDDQTTQLSFSQQPSG
jgi:hypothetical protein